MPCVHLRQQISELHFDTYKQCVNTVTIPEDQKIYEWMTTEEAHGWYYRNFNPDDITFYFSDVKTAVMCKLKFG